MLRRGTMGRTQSLRVRLCDVASASRRHPQTIIADLIALRIADGSVMLSTIDALGELAQNARDDGGSMRGFDLKLEIDGEPDVAGHIVLVGYHVRAFRFVKTQP